MLHKLCTATCREPQAVDTDAAPPRRSDELAFRRALNEARHDNFAHVSKNLRVQLVLRQLAGLTNELESGEVTGTESSVTRIGGAASAQRLC